MTNVEFSDGRKIDSDCPISGFPDLFVKYNLKRKKKVNYGIQRLGCHASSPGGPLRSFYFYPFLTWRTLGPNSLSMEVGTALDTRLLLRGGGCSERPQSLSARDHVTVLASCNPPSMSHGLRRYAVTLSEKQFIRSSYEVCLKLFETIMHGGQTLFLPGLCS